MGDYYLHLTDNKGHVVLETTDSNIIGWLRPRIQAVFPKAKFNVRKLPSGEEYWVEIYGGGWMGWNYLDSEKVQWWLTRELLANGWYVSGSLRDTFDNEGRKNGRVVDLSRSG